MCIRDRSLSAALLMIAAVTNADAVTCANGVYRAGCVGPNGCLLYTSDAADERSSVDLGGRRIIKKKNNIQHSRLPVYTNSYININYDTSFNTKQLEKQK